MTPRTFALGFIYAFSIVEIVVSASYVTFCLWVGETPHLLNGQNAMAMETAIVFFFGGVARLMLVYVFKEYHSHVCETTARVRAVNDRLAESVFGEEADKAREKIRVAADVAKEDLRTEAERTMKNLQYMNAAKS